MRRFTAQFLNHRAGALADAVQRAGAVERHAHDAALLRQCLQDRLPDPPDGVRDELDLLRLVELLCGADESEVAFVDQVGERDSLILILLGHRHDEAEVGAHEGVVRLAVAGVNRARQFRFAFAGNERVAADVFQVLVQ